MFTYTMKKLRRELDEIYQEIEHIQGLITHVKNFQNENPRLMSAKIATLRLNGLSAQLTFLQGEKKRLEDQIIIFLN